MVFDESSARSSEKSDFVSACFSYGSALTVLMIVFSFSLDSCGDGSSAVVIFLLVAL
jgi:hypothetical protein